MENKCRVCEVWDCTPKDYEIALYEDIGKHEYYIDMESGDADVVAIPLPAKYCPNCGRQLV